MLDLIFNSSFWWGLLIAGAVVLVIWICAKYPNARVFVLSGLGILVGICLLGVTIYCGIQLGYYYNAKGGIFGSINVPDSNTVIREDATFSFSNIELVQVEGDRYIARVYSNDAFKLKEDADYTVSVNEKPCYDVTMWDTYITASYTYEFLGEEMESLLIDTLYIRFSFDNNSTYATLTTLGGTDAVNYWNAYFSRNDFDVTIQPIESISQDIPNTDNDVSNYCIINYFVNDEVYSNDVVTKGSVIELDKTVPNYNCLGWALEPHGEVLSSNYIINEDTDFYLIYNYEVKFNVNDEVYTTKFVEANGTFDLSSVGEPSVKGYLFNGWLDESGEIINNTTLVISQNTTIVADMREIYSNFKFLVTSNTAQIRGYTGSDVVLNIPGTISVIDGLYVEGNDIEVNLLNQGVFENNNTILIVNIPKEIKTIMSNCFASSSIISVNIEENSQLKTIDVAAFHNCIDLKSINLENCNNLESILGTAFNECRALNNLILPSSITTLGAACFAGNDALTDLTILAVAPPVISYDGVQSLEDVYVGNIALFGMESNINVHVPSNSISLYQAKEEYSNQIILGI